MYRPRHLSLLKSAAATAFISAVCCFAYAETPEAPQTLLHDKVQQLIRQKVEDGEFASVVIGITDGQRHQFAGFSAKGQAVPDKNSIYEIGSLTKTMTALILAKQIHQGRIPAAQSVAELAPECMPPATSGLHISWLDLATHTSGLPRLPENLQPKNMANPYADYTQKHLNTYLNTIKILPEKGKYAYSNLGYGMLGCALAAVSGKPFEQLIHDEISKPFGMPSTGIQLSADLQKRLQGGHDASGKPVSGWDFDAMAAAGAVHSDTTDMLRYLEVLMAAASSDQPSAEKLVQTAQRDTTMPKTRIALGWHLSNMHGRELVWHNGMTGGYASFAGFSADGKLGVIVLTNTARSPESLGIAALFPQQIPERKAMRLSAEALQQYTGRYALTPAFIISVVPRNNSLTIQATGQPAFRAAVIAEDSFEIAEVGAVITFQRDANGVISQLTLQQNGQRIPGKKLAD